MAERHTGTCSCGAVSIEVIGPPLQMGYCHCANCRRYSGAPFVAFALWKNENLKVTSGNEFLGRYKSSDMTVRGFCRKCGTHLVNDHPSLDLVDVRPVILEDLGFKPAIHLNYEDTVLPIKDGLPKLKDFPESVGGSDEILPE